MSIIPAMQKAEIRRIVVPGQPEQKVSEIPTLTNKPSMVGHVCDLTYIGGGVCRITV
jgi:hypothetical protein